MTLSRAFTILLEYFQLFKKNFFRLLHSLISGRGELILFGN